MNETKKEALLKKESSAKLVVDYAKSGWDDELKRFYSIDDKLSKLLRFITGVLVIFSTFLTWLYVHINEFNGLFHYLVLGSSFVSLVSLLSAMLQAYNGTQLMVFVRPRMSSAVIGLLDLGQEESAKLIAETYLEAISKHREQMKAKEKCFDISYKDVILALSMFVTSLFLLIIIKGI